MNDKNRTRSFADEEDNAPEEITTAWSEQGRAHRLSDQVILELVRVCEFDGASYPFLNHLCKK
jgi:hypothetical protein